MDENHTGNISFRRSIELIGEFYSYGVRHIVISPGSRSTPLTLAAAAHPGFRKHVHIDERSAGFMALGIGKSTDIPALLICTSGTAVANYYPAVIEARMSSTPMIILSADRPPRERTTGAPQTINQIRIYGNYPVYFTDAPLPHSGKSNENEFRVIAAQAWNAAVSTGGPVHINLPFEKPLEPESLYYTQMANNLAESLESNRDHPELHADQGKRDQNEFQELNHNPEKVKKYELNEKREEQFLHTSITLEESTRIKVRLAGILQESRRPLLILGPGNHINPAFNLAVRALADSGIPVLNTPGSNSPVQGICGYDAFLRDSDTASALKPDLIMRTGMHPVSGGIEQFTEMNRDVIQVHFTGNDDYNDALQTITMSVGINNLSRASAVIGPVDKNWLPAWEYSQDRFTVERESLLSHADTLTDGHVFNILPDVIPDDWLVILSNSFPVRDFDLFRPTDYVPEVITNRGASGIDGMISTAAGACIGSGRNGVLFIGDLAAIHDSNSLALSSTMVSQTLIVVILNNGGGTIFRMLPIAGKYVSQNGPQVMPHKKDAPGNSDKETKKAERIARGFMDKEYLTHITDIQRTTSDFSRTMDPSVTSQDKSLEPIPADIYMKFFETPQNVDFGALAAVNKNGYERVSSRHQITSAFHRLYGKPGIHIIECVTSADDSMRIRYNLWGHPGYSR
jgi:2-succinyl-5-enolpyruvyl-6-hydroxy-3-cyclohexene-1-carboxylate synthase